MQCCNARERALILLLSTTGLRSCALGHAMVKDVWDGDRREVRHRIAFAEKNSQLRTITPHPELRAVLHEYLTNEHARGSKYLFPGSRRPGCASPFGVRGVLRSICRRAGLPCFTPHQFLPG